MMLKKEVKYLGHVVSKARVATDPAKIEAKKESRTPDNVKEIQVFSGMVGYYCQYIADFATITWPLIYLTAKEPRGSGSRKNSLRLIN